MFSPFQLGCFIPLCLLSLIITPNTTLFCDPMLGTLPPQGPEARAVARLCPPIPAFLRALRYPRAESDIKLDRRREPITGCTWSWEQPKRLWACGSHPASSKPERDMALGFWEAEPAVPARRECGWEWWRRAGLVIFPSCLLVTRLQRHISGPCPMHSLSPSNLPLFFIFFSGE